MRARACIKCKQYVAIHPNNPINQNLLAVFEQHHRQHTLIIVNLDEIKDSYQPFKNNGSTPKSEHYNQDNEPKYSSESLKNSQ